MLFDTYNTKSAMHKSRNCMLSLNTMWDPNIIVMHVSIILVTKFMFSSLELFYQFALDDNQISLS